ncbi:hypothetical protein N271_gp56 [Salmonella phage Jersey]|uniref:Uncharacterized protein n=1 Tax=Salmonella phage Jersey TaxID=1340534 RepID=S4X5A8_9CAUD|nr:hypothetical protein N271_gp56 [Salmonella phage Jersey]AGP24944.1 hypothetical protein Jersey_56 [Salmonella phage Jersey]
MGAPPLDTGINADEHGYFAVSGSPLHLVRVTRSFGFIVAPPAIVALIVAFREIEKY